MAFEAKILADSISPEQNRLTTLQVTFPRFILAEVNTHRVLSRNSASSRAIPVATQIGEVLDHPAMPVYWGANQAGMQASQELSEEDKEIAEKNWCIARDQAVLGAVALLGGVEEIQEESLRSRLEELSSKYEPVPYQALPSPLHKQNTNRLLEPYMWQTAIVSATEWDNFYALRTDENAQPEFRKIATMMQQAMEDNVPQELDYDEWHVPLALIQEEDYELAKADPAMLLKVAIGRCARVSYMTHDGIRDPRKDVELYDRLVGAGHLSPLEHIARPKTPEEMSQGLTSNFRGWLQYRELIPGQDNFAVAKALKEDSQE